MAAAQASNTGLEKLHEILLPDPVSWVPQTFGWYVPIGLVVLGAAWWAYGRLRHFLANRYRRLALTELATLEQELRGVEKRAQTLGKIPVLLKRTALSAFPRSEVASLSGEKWLAFLDKTMEGKDFVEGEGRLLREMAYIPAPCVEQFSEESIAGLLRLTRRWIVEHHRIPRERGREPR